MSKVTDSLGNLAESASVLFAGAIVGRVLGLLGETVIIRSLQPGAFGEVALAYTVVFALGNVTVLGVHNGVTRLLSATDDTAEQVDVLRSALLIAIVSIAGSVSGLYLLRGWLAGVMDQPSLARWLVPLLPFLVLYPLARIAYGVLRVQGRSIGAVLSKNIGPRILGLGALTVTTIAISAEVGAVVYWVSVQLFILVLSLLLFRRQYPIASIVGPPNKGRLRRLWSFSWPLALSSVLFLMLANMDVLMIGYFLDATSVGYYRSIQPLKQVTTFVVSSFSFLYLPIATEYFESGDLEGLDELFTVSTKWISLATLPFVLVFSLFASDSIAAIFGTAYTPAAPALAVLVGGLFIRALTGLNGDMVRAIHRPKVELYAASGGFGANFLLNVVLIPQYGIVGAAIATVAGYGVYNGIEVLIIYRETGTSPFSYNVIKPLLPTTTLAFAVSILVSGRLGLIQLIGIGLVFTLAQPVSVFLTRSFDQSDLELIELTEKWSGRDLGQIKRRIERQLTPTD